MYKTELGIYIKQIARYPLLTPEEEIDLGKKSLAGDIKARNKLVNSNLRFAMSVVKNFKGYCKRPGISMLDLIQEANIGLIRAAEKFDPARKIKFVTYARWWIKSGIYKYLVKNFSSIRTGFHTEAAKLFFKKGELINIITTADPEKRQEMMLEFSKNHGLSIEAIEKYIGYLDGTPSSLDASIGDGDDTWYSKVPSKSSSPEDIVRDKESKHQVREKLSEAGISPREMEIVERRYLSNSTETLQSIADDKGLSRERIRQIESIVLKKLFRGFNAASFREHLGE